MKKAFIQVINNCAIARDSEWKSVIGKFIDSDIEWYVFDEFCDNVERLWYELDFSLVK